jgi:EAL domain-containing protein (putative c-di-GMP-specific phosphodiesterase class I)
MMHADLALYAAKDAGRGTYRFFAAELRARMEARMALEAKLRRALLRDEFELYYQPVVSLSQDRVVGFEALLRWNDPERGVVRPDQFIPLAEERGLIVPLGAWVLQTACQHAARWPAPVRVAVNISPVQFRNDGLVDTVLAALDLAGLPAERLQLEITETSALQEGDATLAALNELRALGVHIAFDDFGTGFSSLTSLVRIPFDNIKIDQSFLGHLKASQSTAAIVRAIVSLGNNLGLVTTGEGVDTPEQLAFLKQCGCAEAQGYLFSPPRPNAEVPRLLRELGAGAVAG